MLEFNCTKKCSLPMDESLRSMRIKQNPVQLEEGVICNDQLESKGVIQLMEYTGGGLYIPIGNPDTEQNTNAVMVAEIKISVFLEERRVYIDRIFHEYGHEELVEVLVGQVLNFADFYCCSVSFSNRRKNKKLQSLISRDMLAGVKRWHIQI